MSESLWFKTKESFLSSLIGEGKKLPIFQNKLEKPIIPVLVEYDSATDILYVRDLYTLKVYKEVAAINDWNFRCEGNCVKFNLEDKDFFTIYTFEVN